MNKNRLKTTARVALAAALIATLLGGCAYDPAKRVNGDDWRYGFSYPGANYPWTGR
jgi:hypothetical protein